MRALLLTGLMVGFAPVDAPAQLKVTVRTLQVGSAPSTIIVTQLVPETRTGVRKVALPDGSTRQVPYQYTVYRPVKIVRKVTGMDFRGLDGKKLTEAEAFRRLTKSDQVVEVSTDNAQIFKTLSRVLKPGVVILVRKTVKGPPPPRPSK